MRNYGCLSKQCHLSLLKCKVLTSFIEISNLATYWWTLTTKIMSYNSKLLTLAFLFYVTNTRKRPLQEHKNTLHLESGKSFSILNKILLKSTLKMKFSVLVTFYLFRENNAWNDSQKKHQKLKNIWWSFLKNHLKIIRSKVN